MNCKESQERISAVVWQGILQDENTLADHLAHCEACSSFYENYKKGVDGIISSKRIHADTGLYDLLMRSMQANSSRKETFINRGPAVKLVYSFIISTAAIVTGIWAANIYFTGKTATNQESYSNEIASLNSDISGVSNSIVEYYNTENPE